MAFSFNKFLADISIQPEGDASGPPPLAESSDVPRPIGYRENVAKEDSPSRAAYTSAEAFIAALTTSFSPGSVASGMSEAEYVFAALSRVPPDMRYKMIPSLVKNLALQTYGDVRVSGSISAPIMSVRCQPGSAKSTAIPAADIENAAAQVLQANFDSVARPSTNIEGLVSTVLTLTQAIRTIEDNSIKDGSETIGTIVPDDIVDALFKQVDDLSTKDDGKSKVWREGMQIDDNKTDSSKTVFMSKNTNKLYEKQDAKESVSSYDAASARIKREINYFRKILDKAGDDMKNSEYSLDPIRVLDSRRKIADDLGRLKAAVDEFAAANLEGDIRDKPVEKAALDSAESVRVEYVYPPEKKVQGKEQKISPIGSKAEKHFCTDCKEEIVIPDGADVEDVLKAHSHANVQFAEEDTKKKYADPKIKRLMMLNHIDPCLMDDNLFSCGPCGTNLDQDPNTVKNHLELDSHAEKLQQYNIKAQKDMIRKHPDIFGPSLQYELSDLHIVMNKIFVDPILKYAYCGLCRKELPQTQFNINEHIKSKWHDKVLLESLEVKPPTLAMSLPTNSRVKTAQMLDIAGSPQIDISQFEKMLEADARRKSITPQEDDAAENADPTVFQTHDKKYICLLCNNFVGGFSGLKVHRDSESHGASLAASGAARDGLTPEQQSLLMQNSIAVSYGSYPLTFECHVCNVTYTNLQIILEHVKGPHVRVLADSKLKARKKPNMFNSVILHKNGADFWCCKCHSVVAGISAAFSHVKLPGHVNAVDSVKFVEGTQFFCHVCSVKINGEKNVGQHVLGPKHKALATSKKYPPKTPVKSSKDNFQERGVISTGDNMFQCLLCGTGAKPKSEILIHIFTMEHITRSSKYKPRNE